MTSDIIALIFLFIKNRPWKLLILYSDLYYIRLENGWYVRDVPSPILSGGTSSTVPSTPASDGEHEIVSLNGSIQNQSPTTNTSETSKQTRKVLTSSEIRVLWFMKWHSIVKS